MKRRTNLLAVLLSVTMTASAAASSFPVLAQSDADTVMPADASLVEETISFRKTTGTTNKFTFSSGNWEAGSDAHTWSKTPDAANPSALWYQVDFVGSEITVYAGKNHPMGKVEYFIDGESQGVYDLYNASKSIPLGSRLSAASAKKRMCSKPSQRARKTLPPPIR